MSVLIREIGLHELAVVVDVLKQVPEFDAPFSLAEIEKRIANTERIILVAEFAGKPIGCKLAYNRYFDGSIYSWLGGVLPPYRNLGVATLLLRHLETEAGKRFFRSIRFKTRNRHKDMLRFALKHGFYVIGFDGRNPPSESRIELQKEII